MEQEIPCLLWNLEVHYCVHMSLPVVPILSQMNPVHKFLYMNNLSLPMKDSVETSKMTVLLHSSTNGILMK
jgi:hypothetical protein